MKQILNRKEFQYSAVSLFIDSGMGFVLSILFVLVLVLNCKNSFIVAKLTIWVWCGVADKSFTCLQMLVDISLASELCLASS